MAAAMFAATLTGTEVGMFGLTCRDICLQAKPEAKVRPWAAVGWAHV